MGTLASDLLTAARRRRGMSQRDLSAIADVPQSTVSMIESGKRQPSVAMLERLLAAAGFRADVTLTNTVPPSELLVRHGDQVQRLLADYPIAQAWVFGSVARGDDGPDSDLDLLVELDPGASVVDVIGLDEALTGLLGCPVDVVTTAELESNSLLRRGVVRHRRPLVA